MLQLQTNGILYCLIMVLLAGVPTHGRTIDEIIAGASTSVTDFDVISDIQGNTVKVELDMILTIQQYQALYNQPSTSTINDVPLAKRKKRKAIRLETLRWTDKTIPYKIDTSIFSSKDINEVNEAIAEWQKYTCLIMRPANPRDTNFVNFEDGTGCSSYVGMNGGKHPVALAAGCRHKGVIAHEIGHAVGFYHEQNRPDRDDYIIIISDNMIHQNLLHNFKKYPSSSVNNHEVPYDYRSIMHYGGTAFSSNGQYTIKTKDPAFQNVIGNREGLSFHDIQIANIMYNCSDHCDRSIVCPQGGFLGKDCKCWCPGTPVTACYPDSGLRTTTKVPIATKPVITRAPVATSTEPAGCRDMNDNCPAWAKSPVGFCQVNAYVKTYCTKSCQLCGGVATTQAPAPSCKDLREHCVAWKNMGYCRGDFEIFMKSKCSKTCGVCQAATSNSSGLRYQVVITPGQEVTRGQSGGDGNIGNKATSVTLSVVLMLFCGLLVSLFPLQ